MTKAPAIISLLAILKSPKGVKYCDPTQLLIPCYGAFGAVLGTVVAEAIIAFLFVKFDNGYLTYEQIYQKSIKKIIAAMIMLGVIRTLTPYLLISWASFLTLVGIGSLAYVGILVILKDSGLYLIFKLIADKLRKNI